MAPTTIRLRRLFGELAYAQRRMFELRTGLSFTEPAERSRRTRRQISRLHAVWGLTPDTPSVPEPSGHSRTNA